MTSDQVKELITEAVQETNQTWQSRFDKLRQEKEEEKKTKETIEEKIARMEGVKSCEVDFENEMATLVYDNKKVEIDKVVQKVEDMSDGKYTLSDIKTENITNTNSEATSEGGSETGQIMTAPSFELPNLADYFRNIV